LKRLTGSRAIVIHVTSPDEVTCRFADGDSKTGFTFELDRCCTLGSILSRLSSRCWVRYARASEFHCGAGAAAAGAPGAVS